MDNGGPTLSPWLDGLKVPPTKRHANRVGLLQYHPDRLLHTCGLQLMCCLLALTITAHPARMWMPQAAAVAADCSIVCHASILMLRFLFLNARKPQNTIVVTYAGTLCARVLYMMADAWLTVQDLLATAAILHHFFVAVCIPANPDGAISTFPSPIVGCEEGGHQLG